MPVSNRSINLALILLMFFLINGCEFIPEDIPETNLDQPTDGPSILFRLNNMTDTIKLGWVTNFQYSISGTSNRILSVKVDFEGTEIHHYIADNGQTFTFLFDPSAYSNGNYYLAIEIITGSGSGSIADKMGAEGFLYSLEWPVYIDKTLPQGIGNYVISAKQTEKGMELTWPSFNHPNFTSYEVFRQYAFNQTEAASIATVIDPLDNNFIDTTFWEGSPCMYYVRINTPAGPLDGEYMWAFPELGRLQATLNADKTIDVNWDKAKNLESFGYYYVYAGSSSSCIYGTRLIDDPDQNYLKFNFGAFGSSLYIYLKFIPPGITEPYYRYLGYKMITLNIPPIIPVHIASYSVRDRDFILLAGNSAIYRYYPGQLMVENSLSGNLLSSCPVAVSNDGTKLIYYSDGKFYLRQTDDFLLVNNFDGPQGSKTIFYSLSDKGKMLAIDNSGISYLYDVSNGNLISQDTLIIDGYNAKTVLLSNDGTRLIAKTEIIDQPAAFYNYGQDGWVETGRSDDTPYKFFYSADGTRLYIAYPRSIQIRNTDDFSILNSYALDYGYFQCADLKNDRFLWIYVGTENYIIGDLSTGTTLRSLALGFEGNLNLFDNYIIASFGYQLTIQEFK
jgi:hypothetical protein